MKSELNEYRELFETVDIPVDALPEFPLDFLTEVPTKNSIQALFAHGGDIYRTSPSTDYVHVPMYLMEEELAIVMYNTIMASAKSRDFIVVDKESRGLTIRLVCLISHVMYTSKQHYRHNKLTHLLVPTCLVVPESFMGVRIIKTDLLPNHQIIGIDASREALISPHRDDMYGVAILDNKATVLVEMK